MTIADKYVKRFWWKACFMGMGVSILASFLPCLLSYVGVDYLAVNPLLFIACGFAVSLSLPFIGQLFYRLKVAAAIEYASEEQKFDENCYVLFDERFGEKTTMSLFSGDIDQVDTTSESYAMLLKSIESENDTELQYCILLKLAKALSKSDNYDAAIKCLKDAVCIFPDRFIGNIKLAESYERVGAAKEAIQYYLASSKVPKLSNEISDYVHSQIKRIESEGPRLHPPMSGFRYMSH